MKEIANNEYYELFYDEGKNWIFWTMKGFWKSMDVVPDFDRDWDSAIRHAKTPFKIFADLSKLKSLPDDVKAAQDMRQQKLMQQSCEKVSCLMESAITKLSLNKVLKKSGMDKMVQYFTSAEVYEAKKWLMS